MLGNTQATEQAVVVPGAKWDAHQTARRMGLFNPDGSSLVPVSKAEYDAGRGYAVAIQRVAADHIRIFQSLGDELLWGVDMTKPSGLPGAPSPTPMQLGQSALYRPMLRSADPFTRTGTWSSATSQSAAPGGEYRYSTVAGDFYEATIPPGTVCVGWDGPVLNNGGMLRVTLSDGLVADGLPTAQELVNRGTLAALGTLAPTDRILDLYSGSSAPSNTFDYARHWLVASNESLGGKTIRFTVLAETNISTVANRGYVAKDGLTYATTSTNRGTIGAKLRPTKRILSQYGSAWEGATSLTIGASTVFIRNVHGYEDEDTFIVEVDGQPASTTIGDLQWAKRIVVTRDTSLRHPGADSGATDIASVRTTYTMSELGLDVAHKTRWLQAATIVRDYPVMFPTDGNIYRFGRIGSQSYDLSVNGGLFNGQVPAEAVGVFDDRDGVICRVNLLDTALTVGDWAQSAPTYAAIEDRVPTPNNGNLSKIYMARVGVDSPAAVVAGDLNHSAARYSVTP